MPPSPAPRPLWRDGMFWFLALFWTAGMAYSDTPAALPGEGLDDTLRHFAVNFARTLPFGLGFGWMMVRFWFQRVMKVRR